MFAPLPISWAEVQSPISCALLRLCSSPRSAIDKTPQVAPQPLCHVSSVRLVSPHDYQPSQLQAGKGQQQLGTISILDGSGMHLHLQQQSPSVGQNMALPATHPFASVKSSMADGPPFSVVFTVWVSITPPLGSGLRPACMRTSLRKASLICSNKPPLRQCMKYQ